MITLRPYTRLTNPSTHSRLINLFRSPSFLLRMLGLPMLVALAMLFTQCRSHNSEAGGTAKDKRGSAIQGGTFEASGVASVPGTGGVLFIDDSKPGEVVWMQLDAAGKQVGQPKAIPLGVSIEDPEGITFDGSNFYIVGSQSSRKAGDRFGLVRFAFDAQSQTVTNAQAIAGLRPFLVANVPELKNEGGNKGEDGGLNIEGLAWDFEQKRLLLGLRSPLVNGEALLIPVRLRNESGPFAIENLQLEPAMRLSIGGSGIRDIQFDSRLNSFLIISGAPEHHDKTDFSLWQWGGSQSQPSMKMDLSKKMKPEGVARVEFKDGASSEQYIFIVGDANSYARIDYSDMQ